MLSGVVTEIQRFCLDDGPGIRTTVFLKGCPLRCVWCHNPEGVAPEPELMFYAANCLVCGACVAACRQQVHEITASTHLVLQERCRVAGDCVRACAPGALQFVGQRMTDEEVVAEVLEDRAFYESKGGVTLSGGEPLRQVEFALAILQRCKRAGIHTAIETSLCYEWSRLAAVLDWVDLIMFDIKLTDADAHHRYTGASNAALWSNLERLNRSGKPLIARTPLIAGINDTAEEMERIATILGRLNRLLQYELLPYQPLGTDKYAALGRAAPAFSAPSPETLERLAAIGRARNLTVVISGVEAPAHELQR